MANTDLPAYMDAKKTPEERAQLLLQDLTLDEKMAQVSCVFPFGENAKDLNWIRKHVPLGIGEVSTLEMRRIRSLKKAAQWQRDVQETIMKESPHQIPAIFHMEGLCGAFLQDSTSFPSGIARGSSFDPELEKKIGHIVSEQEGALGITQILAPVLDISRDSRMGRQGETYGEDPTLVSVMGTAYTEGCQTAQTGGRKTESTAKHFLGFHASEGGIHGSAANIGPHALREIYAKPFQAAIAQAGLKGIMPCYDTIDGMPVSVSKAVLTDLLRDEMGFRGLCISDYGAVGNSHTVQHVGETMGETGYLSMLAGMDIEMPSPAGFSAELKEMFRDGKADMAVLDQAVSRVLTAKFRMGLFEHPFAMEDAGMEKIYSDPEAGKVSLQSARESLVLLKNDGVLPLRNRRMRIALIGPHADNARMFFGGYTHLSMMESTYAVANSIAGVAGIPNPSGKEVKTYPGTSVQVDDTPEFDAVLKTQKPDCPSLYEALQKMFPDAEITCSYGYPPCGEDTSGFKDALQAVEKADLILLTLGGKYGTCSIATMGEGVDGTDINLPVCQDEFIQKAAEFGKPMIGLHFGGRPVSSDTADQDLDALLECWTPGEYGGQAIAEVLGGVISPSGKMPVSTAYNAGQIPVYYDHLWGAQDHQGESIGFASYVDCPHTPRYCFGQGLSYTSFTYSDLLIDQKKVRPEETVNISFTLKNTGTREGTEIVQLYLSDVFASVTRPVKELAGFARVHLEPGGSRRITFRISPSFLAFTDENMNWKIEKGETKVMIGSSSEDIRLTGSFSVSEDAYIDGKTRQMAAEAEK